MLARSKAILGSLFGQARGSLDAMTRHRVGGWAAADGGVEVEIWLGNNRVGKLRPSIPRPDVAAAFPGLTNAATSGFVIDLIKGNDAPLLEELRVVAKPLRPWLRKKQLVRTNIASEELVRRLAVPAPSALKSPFPRQVVDAIASFWPQDCADLESEVGQLGLLERFWQIVETPEINALPAFADYARFLRMMLAHCRFVEQHFPVTNANAAAGADDFHCKPNSIKELFSIIHQLYVLKSQGVTGDFAEFGCFKGYSSAMLSFACSWLGIRMHVFDSFAGLPEVVGSGYSAGQYAGGLEEVRENIRRFGSVDAVEFHPGFFADSLREGRPPRLMCMWMDVDLEISAKDLLVVAEYVDPHASVFSHECPPDIFEGTTIRRECHPDNPIPPLLDRFDQLDRQLRGHHIAGYTGAFWPMREGTPVVHSVTLEKIISLFG